MGDDVARSMSGSCVCATLSAMIGANFTSSAMVVILIARRLSWLTNNRWPNNPQLVSKSLLLTVGCNAIMMHCSFQHPRIYTLCVYLCRLQAACHDGVFVPILNGSCLRSRFRERGPSCFELSAARPVRKRDTDAVVHSVVVGRGNATRARDDMAEEPRCVAWTDMLTAVMSCVLCLRSLIAVNSASCLSACILGRLV